VKPLAQRERDRNFHSQFVTQPGSPIQSLSDLKGRSFAFGDVNSTSGHLMPEYFMRENKVDPEVIAKAIYTGATTQRCWQSRTARWMRERSTRPFSRG